MVIVLMLTNRWRVRVRQSVIETVAGRLVPRCGFISVDGDPDCPKGTLTLIKRQLGEVAQT